MPFNELNPRSPYESCRGTPVKSLRKSHKDLPGQTKRRALWGVAIGSVVAFSTFIVAHWLTLERPSAAPVRNLLGKEAQEVRSVAFAVDDSRLLTATTRQVSVWDVVTGRHTVLAQATSEESILVECLAPDRRVMAVAAGASVRLVDLSDGHDRMTLAHDADDVTSIAFDSTASVLAVADSQRRVTLWDAVAGRRLTSFVAGDTGTVTHMRFSSDREILTTFDTLSNGQLKLWNVRTGRLLASLGVDTPGRAYISFSADGNHAAINRVLSRQVTLWDLADRKMEGVIRSETSPFIHVAFADDAKIIAAGAADGTVHLFDVGTEKVFDTLHYEGDLTVSCFSSDGRLLAIGGLAREGNLYGLVRSLIPHVPAKRATGKMTIRELPTMRELVSLDGLLPVRCLAFSVASSQLALGGMDGSVIVLNIEHEQ